MRKIIIKIITIVISILTLSVLCCYPIVQRARAQEAELAPLPAVTPPLPGVPVNVVGNIPEITKEVKDTIWNRLWTALNKAANRTLGTILNKYLNMMATDAAIYVATGGKGQTPTFEAMGHEEFWRQAASEAGGTFVENYFTALKEGTKTATRKEQSLDCADYPWIGTSTVTVVLTRVVSTDPVSLAPSVTYPDMTIYIRQPSTSTDRRQIDTSSSSLSLLFISPECQGAIKNAEEILKQGGGEQVDYAGNTLPSSINLLNNEGKVGTLKLSFGSGDINVCQPSSMMVALKIGLGLPSGAGSKAGAEPSCDWMEMKKNWEEAYKESITNGKAYLQGIQNMFDIGSNDLSVAFSLGVAQSSLMDFEAATREYDINLQEGYKPKQNVGGRYVELPGGGKATILKAQSDLSSPWLTMTEDVFINVLNTFTSILSKTLFDRGMAKLMEVLGGGGGGMVGTSQLTNFYSVGSFGRAQSEAIMAPLLDMTFGPGQDIDLLSNLSSCPDINNPGPMNCVINSNFVQAITDGLTVGEALQKNLLNPNARFGGSMYDVGFNIESGDISWRAMKILRKYRILPVGWELAAEKLTTLGNNERVTIGDVVGCYSPFDGYETGYNQGWCRGLVDPNWPLKAPLSYCVKSGFGGQIDYMDVMGTDQPASSTVGATLSSIILLRSSNYCADEQSCLKENNNGGCDVYGYCVEDRRTWKFPSNGCEPYFNTCQAFTNAEGENIGFLSNTLDYAHCNADNSGCQAYCNSYNWASSSYNCTAGGEENKYYLNGRVETCAESEDGCSEIIRLINGGGVNLLFNSNFEFSQTGASSSNNQLDNWYFSGPSIHGTIVDNTSGEVYSGNKSLKIVHDTNQGGDFSDNNPKSQPLPGDGLLSYDWSHPNKSSLPKNFLMRPGVSYTLSAYVYSDEAPVTLAIGNGQTKLNSEAWKRSATSTLGSWQKLSVTLNNDEYYNANAFAIYTENSGTFYVDDIMFEISSYGNNGFNQYRAANYSYEKILPSYLRSVCYKQVGNSSLVEQNDAPPECDDYARICLPAEVDCQLFINQTTGDEIPAKVNLQNYCPATCVGFASFWQQPTQFESGHETQLIPGMAETCLPTSVGCSEFTNLDNLSGGGENREYFSYLRQCVKPSDPEANCATFYMWQNTASTGLQLYSYNWQASSSGAPQLIGENTCSASSLWPDSLDYDADCREVRNQVGAVFYVPYSKTITCTDDCHPYRLSDYDINEQITSTSSCRSAGGHWLADRALCVVCQGTGRWDDNNQACIYKGAPQESQTCSASQNGCRQYSGTGAANWRLVINDTFDDSIDGWIHAVTSSATIRTYGHSLLSTGNDVQKKLPSDNLVNGAKYRLQFFAKSSVGPVTLSDIHLESSNASTSINFDLPTNGLPLSDNEWKFYSVVISQPINIQATSDNSEGQFQNVNNASLYFSASGRFLLDEVRLMEVRDEYYLLKDTLDVPDVCNEDYNGVPAAGFMLGCQKYLDQNSNIHYLHSFNDLCQESAVGCEAMLSTHNWSTYYYPFRPTNSPSSLLADITPADEVIYAVYDPDKFCSYNDKGCQRLGKESTYEDQAVYTTTFLKFDPDRYRSDLLNSIKCLPEDVGCQTWSGSAGLSYFKDPGNQLCELKFGSSGNTMNWYKYPIKRCTESDTFKFCISDQDCASVSSSSYCSISDETELCPVNNLVGKTIGLGGGIVKQPVKYANYNWVGLCPTTQSGCTEYIDPLSKVNGDLLAFTPSTTNVSKTINLEPFTAYTIQAHTKANNNQTEDINWQVGGNNYNFWILNSNNQLISTSGLQILGLDALNHNDSNPVANGYYGSAIFMTNASTQMTVTIPASSSAHIQEVSVRKLLINYNLNQDLNSEECTDGKTEYDKGCLLFNERTYLQNRYASLLYDTDKTANDINGVSPQSSADNTANRLIKVKPSRVCGKWLECTTYNTIQLDNGTTKNICSAFGLCDAFDAYNNCAHFIDIKPSSTVNQTVGDTLTLGEVRNLTGYSKVGYTGTGYYNDLYNLAAMSEQGLLVKDYDINGSFELVSGKGLTLDGNSLIYDYSASRWADPYRLAKVIVSPQEAISVDHSFNSDYLPPDGNNFLRLGTRMMTDSNRFYGYVRTDSSYYIPVQASTTYSLSGSYRTTNGAGAGFRIWEYTCKNPTTTAPCRPNGLSSNITQSIDMDDTHNKWQTQALVFTTKPDTKYIAIELDAFNENGIAYFDNIQLAPVLAIRSDRYAVPSCRLYPEGNSLSCDYSSINNPVIRKKGLLGYCLEYDPANEKNCLLWYPLDKIAADPIEEGIGYNGKFPLYYCLQATTSLRLEYRHAFWLNSDDPNKCPPHYYRVNLSGGCNDEFTDIACVPKNDPTDGSIYNNLIIPQYGTTIASVTSSCNHNDGKDIQVFGGVACLDCKDPNPDTMNANVNSINDGWYLYDESLPEDDCTVSSTDECASYRNQYDCLHHKCGFAPDSNNAPGICAASCSWIGDYFDCIPQTTSPSFTYSQCTGTCYTPNQCDSSKGQLELFYDEDGKYNTLGRGPRLRPQSFPAPSLEFLCKALCPGCYDPSGGDDSRGSCLRSSGNEVLLGSEIYRDQFSIVVTNQSSSVPAPTSSVYCTKFVKVVDEFGNNIFWSDRVKEGSSFQMPCYIPNASSTGFEQVSCAFSRSSIPFASIAYPAGLGNYPDLWDGAVGNNNTGNEPLFYQDAASGVHLGRIFSEDQNNLAHPRYLFAKSYSFYEWKFDQNAGLNGVHGYTGDSGNYSSTSSSLWEPPRTLCSGGIRPSSTSSSSYCLVKPQIKNVKINGKSADSGSIITFSEPVFTAELTFNSIIDKDQKPLSQITINWGDGSEPYNRSGSFLDHPDPASPHRYTHRYICQENAATGGCRINNLSITIQDHWGGTSTAYSINILPNASQSSGGVNY